MPARDYSSAPGPVAHELGPENARLEVATHRDGLAAKAGHDLVMEVTRWRATLTLGEDEHDCSATLEADPRSLRVREGRGGAKALSEDDRAEIERRVVESVLGEEEIRFRSSEVKRLGPRRIWIAGDLRIRGASGRVSFELDLGDDGSVDGTVALRQRAWGIKPYSALMGALRVSDLVDVSIAGRLTGR